MRQYDPQQVTAVWTTVAGSVDILEGAVAETFLEIFEDNTRWGKEGDREGNYVRNKDNRRGGGCRVTITAKSPLNKTLNDLAIADDLGEAQVGTIVVKDLNGDTLITLIDAYLQGPVRPSYGATAAPRVYTFDCSRVDQLITGQDVV